MLEGLNDEQREAAALTSGPLLILAGAGSGKTKTLTHRIAQLIAVGGVWPSEILAVTFTNKAAKEMRHRLWQLLEPADAQDGHEAPRSFMPWMGTFHGICVKLLRIDGHNIGIKKNFVIYDEDDRQSLLKKAIKDAGCTDKQIKPKVASAAISSAKNQMVDPLSYADSARFPFEKQIAAVYTKYEELRIAAGALDFDDLLIETVRLLRESDDVRHKWQAQFKHVLIDEYQDTNAAQYAMVKLLVNEHRNICVVGDDWQSIYSWRGADFTNILNFERDFPGAMVVKLEQNYRSSGSILDAAHTVIAKNTKRTDKKMWTAKGKGLPIQLHANYDENEEAFGVASRVSAQVEIGARQYGDFAALYRTNAQSYTLERAFIQHRIPYQIIGGVRFYDRMEVKDIVAYLRLATMPTDIVSFSRIVNVPKRGIGAASLEKFLLWQSNNGFDIVGALVNAEQVTGLAPKARDSLSKLGEIIRMLQVKIQNNISPSEVITSLVGAINYTEYLLDGTPGGEEREANIGSLISDSQSFATVTDFLEEVALMSSVDGGQSEEKVTLMTLHAAKGLEFPVVFMVGLEEGSLPHARVFEAGNDDLEEERRLCYVGMTRAREELHISYASSRLQFGQRSYSQPSRFLSDMGMNVASAPSSMMRAEQQDDFFDDMNNFEVGDRVRSLQFGSGEVVDIDGMAVSVIFDSGQQKKLNVAFARLEKLA